jgi:hypothetical protein
MKRKPFTARTKQGIVIGVAAVSAVTLTTAASTATAQPVASKTTASTAKFQAVGLSPQTRALMAAQVPLVQAADRLQALVAKDRASGFTATTLDNAGHGLTVRWKGAVPAAVTAELGRDRADGIAVTVIPAAHSWHEIQAEMNRLGDQLFNAKSPSGDTIVAVQPTSDDSALTVTLAPGTTAANQKAAVQALSPAALTTRAKTEFPKLASSLPLTVKTGARMVPFSSREADTTPYYAGGVLKGPQYGTTCTTGYAATRGTQLGLLTAAHCGWQNFNTGAGVGLGRTSAITYSYDEQFIPTSAAPWVWDGPAVGFSGQFFKQSVATEGVYGNQRLCTSGAYSGAVCGNEVIGKITLGIPDPDGPIRSANLWMIYNTNFVGAVGNMDSGGPAFGLTNGNADDVDVALISGGDTTSTTTCQGVQGRICTWEFYISSATDAASAMGASIWVY